MKYMITKLFACFLLFFTLEARAQLRAPVTNNDLRNNLEKIINDYPNSFSSLRGDTLEIKAQSIEFTTLLDFRMAPENWITQYSSDKPVYSWQALMLTTEDSEEAIKKYKWLFKQLKAMTINLDGGYSFSLDGEYEEPDQSKEFFSCILKLTPNASNMPKLKVEASLIYQFPEWKVSLLVYEKEREDHERGDIYGE